MLVNYIIFRFLRIRILKIHSFIIGKKIIKNILTQMVAIVQKIKYLVHL